MAQLVIVRTLHFLPGREAAALQWLRETEPIRQQAGQITQYVWRSLVDPGEYQFVQIWQSRDAYERWRKSPERAHLADERTRYMTHGPTTFYELCA